MSNIIKNKLHLYDGGKPITALAFLRYYHKLIAIAAKKLGLNEKFSRNFVEQEINMQLEIIACDIHCSSDLPSVIALALIFIHLERFIADQKIEEVYAVKILNLYAFANELKKFCNVSRQNTLLTCIQIYYT